VTKMIIIVDPVERTCFAYQGEVDLTIVEQLNRCVEQLNRCSVFAGDLSLWRVFGVMQEFMHSSNPEMKEGNNYEKERS